MVDLGYLKLCTDSLVSKKSFKTSKLVFWYSFYNLDNKSNIYWPPCRITSSNYDDIRGAKISYKSSG